MRVVPACPDLPIPPPAAMTAPGRPESFAAQAAARESVFYFDQQSGSVYDARGNLVQAADPNAPALPNLPHQQGSAIGTAHHDGSCQPLQRSTSIKWHPSISDGSNLTRRFEQDSKDFDSPDSPRPSWNNSIHWNSQPESNVPTSDSADLLRHNPRPSFSRAVELELEEEDDSPYPEVRASVSNVDDPTMPSITFRSVLLGLGLSAFSSAVNTFLSQRNPPIQIFAIVIQILVHPLGTVLANVLPIRSFQLNLPRLRSRKSSKGRRKAWRWSFNPGPWNIKEHTVVLISATTGLNPSYSLSILLAQDLTRFWDDPRSFLYGFLSVCAPQLIGLALAGFVRPVLVDPASMLWPQNLAVSTVLNTLHAGEEPSSGGRTLSRLRFFQIASLLAFVFYFLPGYLFTALSIFNWVCWIWPDNVPVNVVFGVSGGLGASFLTFDWTQIVYLGSPLITPWWAQANLFGGFVLGIWIAAPLLYWTNALHTSFMPLLSGSSFDRFGQHYNVSRVSPDHKTLHADAYAAYSQVYISAGLVVAYFGGFALITAAVVHTTLYHGRFVLERLRSRMAVSDDVHARLIRKYPSVPVLWYVVLLIIGLGMAIVLTAAYDTGLPIWALMLAILIPVAYLLPFGLIFAISSLPAGTNLVAELLASWLLPGKPLPVMMFKTVSQQTTTFSLLFAQDQKLGNYMKIGPRSVFLVQITSIIVSSAVQIVTKDFLRSRIKDLCDPNQAQRFTCPTVNIFFTASVIWGAIGVERSFGKSSAYHWLFYGLVVGAVVPVLTWYLARRYKWRPMQLVSAPIIFVGMSLAPPASGINFTSAILVGWFFGYWMRKHRVEWWSRYNFVLAGALDFGTIMSVSVSLAAFVLACGTSD